MAQDFLAGGTEATSRQLGAVRKLASPPAPPDQPAPGLWGLLGSVASTVRSSDAAAARRLAIRLRFATTRDGSALRLHVMSASKLDCWQVRSSLVPWKT